MVLEDAHQAVTATQRMLDVVRAGAVATTELRAALEQTRVLLAAGAAFQTAAAELIAARERHGDGGAEVLAVSAGLTQSEAHSQVKTAQVLRKVPELRDAVQTGEVSSANARRLADVITKTSADAVAGDAELLKQAASLRPEQFGVATRRWITAQQGDNGASEHARQRAKRYLKFYDTEDGMIALHGEFDKITGTRIHNRIRHVAGQLFANDKKHPKEQRREFTQCMADALDHSTNTPATNTGNETSNRTRNTQNVGSVRRVNDESNASSSTTRNGQDAATDCGEDTDTSKQAEHVNKAGNHQDARTRNGQSINTDTTTADNSNNSSENVGDDKNAADVTKSRSASNHATGENAVDGKDAADATKSRPASNHATGENTDAGGNAVDALSTTAPQSINEASTTTGGEDCDADAVETADNSHDSTVTNGENGVDAISTTAPQTINETSTADGGAICGVDAVETRLLALCTETQQTGGAVCDVDTANNGHDSTVTNGENGVDAISTTAPQSINETSTADGGEACGVDAVETRLLALCTETQQTGGAVCDVGAAETADNNHRSTVANGEVQGTATAGWVADITLIAHVDDSTGELIAELSDGTRLPDAVLEELSCNTRWTGLIYDRVGDAIWRSRSRRTVTETQWQTLLNIYGGCFHCGAPPSICQAHHIIPYSQGGATSVKNMVMVCWNCHHNIHHNNWHIQTHDDNQHTLHPPTNPSAQSRHGPAHADSQSSRSVYRGRSPNIRTRTQDSDRDNTASKPRTRRGRSPTRTQNNPSRDKNVSRPRNRKSGVTSKNPTHSAPNSNQKERSPQTRNPDPATL